MLDINGWFENGSESAPGAYFYAAPPTRICDTRSAAAVGYTTECTGSSLGAGATLADPVGDVNSIPATGGDTPLVAMIANVTAVCGELRHLLHPLHGRFLPAQRQ